MLSKPPSFPNHPPTAESVPALWQACRRIPQALLIAVARSLAAPPAEPKTETEVKMPNVCSTGMVL